MNSLLLLLLLLLPATQSRDAKLQKDFLRYRNEAIETIEQHAKTDPDCPLKRVIPTLKSAVIIFAYNDDQPRSQTTRAWSFRDQKTGARVIVINSRLEWNVKDSLVTLVHEGLHLTDYQGRPICGPDVREPDGTPVCNLFGLDLFTSEDISNAIRRHLYKE
jgi:hypothetical protein